MFIERLNFNQLKDKLKQHHQSSRGYVRTSLEKRLFDKLLQEKLNNLEQVYASQQQAAQQQTQQEALTSISSFQNQVDEKGNIRNVHFEDVRNDMADLIENAERQGRQLSLEEAYETACWANPQIRNVKLTQANKKRKEEAQKKSKQASKIAQTNLSTKPLAREGIATDASGDIKDTLEETLASINNRH